MRKYFLLALALFVFTSTASAATPTLVGGDRDAHGCIGSAGYKWSVPMKQCIRSWEYYTIEADAVPSTGVAKLDSMIAKKAEKITREFSHGAEEAIASMSGEVIAPDQYTLSISYEVVSTGAIVSVKMSVYSYLGGAHGISTLYTWNYDTQKGRLIPLWRVISPTKLRQVAKKTETSLESYYREQGYELDMKWAREGLDPSNRANYRTFTLLADPSGKLREMMIYFADYQIGPHAIGMPTVRIILPSLSVTSGNE